MFLNRPLTLLLLFLNLLNGAFQEELVRYSRYEGKQVDGAVAVNLLVDGPFKVNAKTAYLSCGMKCNLQSPCSVFSLNATNYCTLYSDQTTIFDLQPSTTSSVYAKFPITACNNPRSYADFDLGKCKQMHNIDAACNRSEQCDYGRGLDCFENKCRCKDYDEK